MIQLSPAVAKGLSMPCRISRSIRAKGLWLALAALTTAALPSVHGAELTAGHHPEIAATAATRIDWTFALANQSTTAPPADWLTNYDVTAQTYEAYVPRGLKAGQPAGLIVFISPGDRATGLNSFRKICDAQKLIFVSPHHAGNSTATPKRVRIVLDVLDDVRRRREIDAERTYIGGFSGGGRIACAIAFALPEYFGGVVPVCAAGDLREETWLRHRVIDRLSVAHLTGDGDFNRGEVERFRSPLLAAVGVRSKVWVAPNTGHAIPSPDVVTEAVNWLEADVNARRKFAKQFPAASITSAAAPSREESARQLLDEGKGRIQDKKSLYSGLMQLQGVLNRWPDLPEAEEAKTILLKYESADDRTWEADDIAEQRKFLVARATCLSDYASGPLPQQYAAQRKAMLSAAIELWNLILSDGQDADAVAAGNVRLPQLQKMMEEER